MRKQCTSALVILAVCGLAGLNLTLGPNRPVTSTIYGRPAPAALHASAATRSASFEENRGQHDPRVRFMARGANFTLYLTGTESMYVLPIPAQASSPAGTIQMLALRTTMVGARPDAELVGESPIARQVNYLMGREAGAWVTGVPTFERVRERGVYDGVDLVWYGNDAGTLEYDVEIAARTDPRAIAFDIAGASSVEIADNGDLRIHTDAGVIAHAKPVAYQERDGSRQPIASAYELRGGSRVGFRLGPYDTERPLVLDPSLGQLAFSSYLGGAGTDAVYGLAVDGARNVYVAGTTTSTNFPTAPGTFDVSANGSSDIFVTKLNAAATTALYSTYIGGSGSEREGAVAVDAAGRVYVVGSTSSPNFPTTAGAFDTTYNSQGLQSDAFVIQIAPNGATLGYGTYLGATETIARDVAVDTSGNAYVVGVTTSVSFPVTAGAFDTTHNGHSDFFVTKLNPTGSSLVYSTLLGGHGDDVGVAIALAGTNAIVAGGTGSWDFPMTSGAFDSTFGDGCCAQGAEDAVVAVINTAGNGLVGSTFLGGFSPDEARDVAFGTDAFVHVAGETRSTNFPTTAGAFDQALGGTYDGFVTKLPLNMAGVVYSTLIGGAQFDTIVGLALEPRQCVPGFPCPPSHRVFVTGYTESIDFPITAGAFDSALTGPSYNQDPFVVLLNLAGSAVDYGTYLGGTEEEDASAIAADSKGNVYIGGLVRLGGTGFPIAGDSVFQKAPRGGTWDGFVSKLGSYVVSGRIVNAAGVAMPGITVTASLGFSGTTVTDAQGFYVFDTPSTGSYRITPNQSGFTFTPTFRDFTNPQSNRVGNFTRQ